MDSRNKRYTLNKCTKKNNKCQNALNLKGQGLILLTKVDKEKLAWSQKLLKMLKGVVKYTYVVFKW